MQKPKDTKEWKSFSFQEYFQAAEEMVHFSAKVVNSNTPAFGIRLSSAVLLDLPYIAASALDRTSMQMEYTKFSPSLSRAVKQINAVRINQLHQFESVPPAEIEYILSLNELLSSGYVPNASFVGVRLRQIILQDENGNDISATPLPCTGFSLLLNERINDEFNRENQKNGDGKRINEKGFIRRNRVYLGVGGSKPHNVALNARAMQKPLIFMVPSPGKSPEIRKAWGAYYKGIPIRPNLKILKKFIQWQEKELFMGFDRIVSDLQIREREAKFLTDLTKDILSRADTVEKLLHANIENLPDLAPYSPTLPFVQQALLNRPLRTMAWRREFSTLLYSEIIGQYVYINQEKKSLEATLQNTKHWIGIIEEALK